MVGFDGTETARRAVVEAARLAGMTNASLHVIRVLDDQALRQGVTTAEMDSELVEQAEQANAELVRAPSSEGGIGDLIDGVDITSAVLHGTPVTGILRYVDDVGADLIVVGNHRVQGLERLLGSVAIGVLRQAPCSVYVAHTRDDD